MSDVWDVKLVKQSDFWFLQEEEEGKICHCSKHFIFMMQHITQSYHQLRARRALSLFNDVPLRTRRALSLYKVYGDSALLVSAEHC